jgi:L,D-peptidoglycan transpeptidase YkuD (ErfK/YbiS/YcfS/YnhG family)
MRWTALLTPVLLLFAGWTRVAAVDPLENSRQAIVVLTPSWDSPQGRLLRFQRSLPNGPWQAIGSGHAVVVGRNGLGWGLGLLATGTLAGPIKKEGDGRAPAGVFRLGTAFGYADPDDSRWIKMPYQHCVPTLECVDDPASIHYNSVLNRTGLVTIDWTSSEEMRRQDDQYRLGIVVEHNMRPTVSGKGSCIFLHLWAGPGKGTSGCTAMRPEDMESLLRWLDPELKPVLIQLPREQYSERQDVWKLPTVGRVVEVR